MFFKLEANNFMNSKGEDLQTKAKYFKDGYVDTREDEEVKPPGFWANLVSGGKYYLCTCVLHKIHTV